MFHVVRMMVDKQASLSITESPNSLASRINEHSSEYINQVWWLISSYRCHKQLVSVVLAPFFIPYQQYVISINCFTSHDWTPLIKTEPGLQRVRCSSAPVTAGRQQLRQGPTRALCPQTQCDAVFTKRVPGVTCWVVIKLRRSCCLNRGQSWFQGPVSNQWVTTTTLQYFCHLTDARRHQRLTPPLLRPYRSCWMSEIAQRKSPVSWEKISLYTNV